MSNLDSESDRGDGRGRSEGSRRTQFSAARQPEERRKPARRKSLQASLLSELRQPVTLSKEGRKSRKVEFFQALLHSISRDLPKASLSDKFKFLRELHRLGLTGLLEEQAKLDAERAELEAERREVAKSRHLDRMLAESSRAQEQRWRGNWYATATVLSEVREHVEWGEGCERLAEQIEVICRAFERDREMDARFDRFMEDLRISGLPDDPEDEDCDGDDDRDEDDCDDNPRDVADGHDASTDGAVEYDPSDYDESALPNTGDPDDPALDLANGQVGPEDLIPPAGDDDGED